MYRAGNRSCELCHVLIVQLLPLVAWTVEIGMAKPRGSAMCGNSDLSEGKLSPRWKK
jgi:hypothetical protein